MQATGPLRRAGAALLTAAGLDVFASEEYAMQLLVNASECCCQCLWLVQALAQFEEAKHAACFEFERMCWDLLDPFAKLINCNN